MRVLHVSETFDGGVGRYLSLLVKRQVAEGWDVTVAAPADGPWRRAVVEAGAEHAVWAARPQPGLRTVSEVAALRRVVKATRPDVVHVHSSKAGLAGRLVLRGRLPTVLQPHSWSFFAVTGVVRRLTLGWERLGARWSTVVLCVSAAEAQAAREERIAARCVVIPNGIDLAAHRAASEEDRRAARARLGLAERPLVVCVGRLHRQKGQHRLLDAWPGVRASVPDAQLVLVGAGPDEAALRARAVDGVVLVGSSNDVGSWLAAADVVAAPSTWEGMSLSLLEAMAAGRSVVVSDVPAMTEVVTSDLGAVVPLDDAGALASALVTRLLDPGLTAREGAAARARVERDHDLGNHLDRVVQLYRELVP